MQSGEEDDTRGDFARVRVDAGGVLQLLLLHQQLLVQLVGLLELHIVEHAVRREETS